MIDARSFEGEGRNWKVMLTITFLAIVLAAILIGLLRDVMMENTWLQTYCNVDIVKEFSTDVNSADKAGELAGEMMKIEKVEKSKSIYCKGYGITSTEKGLHFLCEDGRLYKLTVCRIIEQGEATIPFLPSGIPYGD